ncbi:MAG: CapA family protein [bacterium]|nr:CapA family protein [bacterium]
MKHKKALIGLIIGLAVVAIGLGVFIGLEIRSHGDFGSAPEGEIDDEKVVAVEDSGEVTIIAVGDVLMHTPLLNYAKQGNGKYDFNLIFSETKDESTAADLAVCNQETIIAHDIAPDGGIKFIFNTPDAIGEAEIAAGYDLILQATNHSYDYGVEGILGTIAFWDSHKADATMIGLYDSQKRRDTIEVLEINGIKIAVLNYTYGLNGFSLPSDKQYLLTILNNGNMSKIVDDIKRAEDLADFTIVFPHWGIEDQVGKPVQAQVNWAQTFTQAGADLIIGTHPHVCENIEWIESENGNRALCYYSLGNFASNQEELPEVLGGMAKVKIVKDFTGVHIDEKSTGVIPLVTHNVHTASFTNKVIVYKLSDYTEALAKEHTIRKRFDSSFSKAKLDELANKVFGKWILE